MSGNSEPIDYPEFTEWAKRHTIDGPSDDTRDIWDNFPESTRRVYHDRYCEPSQAEFDDVQIGLAEQARRSRIAEDMGRKAEAMRVMERQKWEDEHRDYSHMYMGDEPAGYYFQEPNASQSRDEGGAGIYILASIALILIVAFMLVYAP